MHSVVSRSKDASSAGKPDSVSLSERHPEIAKLSLALSILCLLIAITGVTNLLFISVRCCIERHLDVRILRLVVRTCFDVARLV